MQRDAERVEALKFLGLIAFAEKRITESIDFLKKVTKLTPKRARAFSNLGAAYLLSGDTRSSLRQLKTATLLDPDSKEIARLCENAVAQHRKRVPSIHLNTLPKSGSLYIWANLAMRLAVARTQISCTFFPDDMIVLRDIRQMAEGGFISQSHLPASSLNRRILCSYLDRIIVHVRDPRQATLSWSHHVDKYSAEDTEEIRYVKPPLPKDFSTRSFEERLDWQIENHLPHCIQWIEGWLDAEEDPEFTTKILFTRYEDFHKDAEALYSKILDFFEIPQSLVDNTEEIDERPHFRKGRTNEWREVFTPDQIARATEVMTDRIVARFGWER